MPFLSYEEKKIYYKITESKNNQAIIFIHGSGENSNIWKNQLNLSVNFNLIAIDLPSHNKSEEFPELTLDLYVDVVREFIDHFNYQKIILCGHSLGGAIAQAYYFKYPKDLSGLILCGTGAKLRVSPVILENLKNNYEEFLKTLPAGVFFRKTSKDIIADVVRDASKVKPEVTYTDFSICDKFDTLDKTDTIKIPTLIICGKVDVLTPVKYSQFFKDKIANSELLVIKNSGHMAMLEKPKEINEAIINFLKKV